MAAYWVLSNVMADWEAAVAYVDERVSSDRTHWRSRLRGTDSHVVDEWLSRCDKLSPAQEWIVGEIRKKMLTLPPR